MAGGGSPSDAELIARVRAGDAPALDELRSRHVSAARRLVRQMGPSGTAVDDLVDEGFMVVARALRRGTGPDLNFRIHLFAVLRWLALRRTDRTGELDPIATEPPPAEGLARAYESLPERGQAVLWYRDVERARAAAVEAHLGMSSTEVGALAYRARDELRRAYVTLLVPAQSADTCRVVCERLVDRAAGALPSAERARVERHLEDCAGCAGRAAELDDLSGSLVDAIAPRYLGPGWQAYLSETAAEQPEASPSPAPAPAPGSLRSTTSQPSLLDATAVPSGW